MPPELYEAAHAILTKPVRGRFEELGGEARQTGRDEKGEGCAGQEACGDPAPHAGGRRPLRRSSGSGMSGPANPSMAPCSRPSTPLRAACRGGLRPMLTAPARGAFENLGRDGETPFNRTKKLRKGEAIRVSGRPPPEAASLPGRWIGSGRIGAGGAWQPGNPAMLD